MLMLGGFYKKNLLKFLNKIEKGTITRDEVRKYLKKNTIIDLDDSKDGDQPPITSVTPTNDLRTNQNVADFDEKLAAIEKTIKDKIPKPRGRPKKH